MGSLFICVSLSSLAAEYRLLITGDPDADVSLAISVIKFSKLLLFDPDIPLLSAFG